MGFFKWCLKEHLRLDKMEVGWIECDYLLPPLVKMTFTEMALALGVTQKSIPTEYIPLKKDWW